MRPSPAEPAVEAAPARQHQRDAARLAPGAVQLRHPAPHLGCGHLLERQSGGGRLGEQRAPGARHRARWCAARAGARRARAPDSARPAPASETGSHCKALLTTASGSRSAPRNSMPAAAPAIGRGRRVLDVEFAVEAAGARQPLDAPQVVRLGHHDHAADAGSLQHRPPTAARFSRVDAATGSRAAPARRSRWRARALPSPGRFDAAVLPVDAAGHHELRDRARPAPAPPPRRPGRSGRDWAGRRSQARLPSTSAASASRVGGMRQRLLRAPPERAGDGAVAERQHEPLPQPPAARSLRIRRAAGTARPRPARRCAPGSRCPSRR